jgi:peroxiredoxin
MAERIEAGNRYRDFSLKDQYGKIFRLSDQSGRRVLLSFHPLAWTPVCADQMRSLEENKGALDAQNTVAVGISVDSVPCKNAWAESLGIKNTFLLADFLPHGGVAKTYGIFREEDGFSERSNILVDEKGRVAFVKVYDIGNLPSMEEIIGAIKKLDAVKR